MLKNGIRNGELAKILTQMGEGEIIAISGCRFALPEGIPIIDLALTDNVPTMEQVLCVISENFSVSEITRAEEMDLEIKNQVENLFSNVRYNDLTYRQIQVLVRSAKAIVRTGDMAFSGVFVLKSQGV